MKTSYLSALVWAAALLAWVLAIVTLSGVLARQPALDQQTAGQSAD